MSFQQTFWPNNATIIPGPPQQIFRPTPPQQYIPPTTYNNTPLFVQQQFPPQVQPAVQYQQPPVAYQRQQFPQFVQPRSITPIVLTQPQWQPTTFVNAPFIQPQAQRVPQTQIMTQSIPLTGSPIRPQGQQTNNLVSPNRFSLQNGVLVPINQQPFQLVPQVQQSLPQSKPQEAVQKQVPQPQQKAPQQPKKQPTPQKPQQIAEEKNFEDAINKTKELFQPNQDAQSEELEQQPEQQPQEQQEQDLQDLALQYEDGYIYRGQGFEPSTREGYGVLSDQNDNEVYSGYWHDNQYHGDGKLQNFQAEQLQEPYDFTDLNNIENFWNSYEGNFNDGKMHGRGILTFTNGEKFDGTFDDGSIEGPGTYYTQEGQVIQGFWKDGVYQQQEDYE